MVHVYRFAGESETAFPGLGFTVAPGDVVRVEFLPDDVRGMFVEVVDGQQEPPVASPSGDTTGDDDKGKPRATRRSAK